LDGTFERRANFFGEACGSKKPGVIGFFSIDSTQPEEVEAVLRVQLSGALAGRDSAIPVFDHEVGTAEKVVSAGIVRGTPDLLCQDADGIVDLTGIQHLLERCLGNRRAGR
jgi:hypothetical protein